MWHSIARLFRPTCRECSRGRLAQTHHFLGSYCAEDGLGPSSTQYFECDTCGVHFARFGYREWKLLTDDEWKTILEVHPERIDRL